MGTDVTAEPPVPAAPDAPRLAFWDEPRPGPWWSWWHVPELVAVFVAGVAVVTFLYGGDEGVPGYDSFYHIKMAVLLPEIGLVDRFKWLTTTIFEERFVSHHWGFHALMGPFVRFAERRTGDPVDGARWCITFFFALSMVLFHVLLMTQRVRLRWLWLGLYLVMPGQFFGRHIFIRAIAPSLACMLLILLLMFRRWYIMTALVIAAYIHLYLGAVFYVPLLVGAYFAAGFLGEDGDRVSWTLPVWALGGWLVGILTHPYRSGIPEFLAVQVFGSGLTPEIGVGQEWKSYTGELWHVVFVYFGLTLSMLVVSLVARMRMAKRLNAREAGVLIINFVFLTMAFRQRRFIEYWPPFGLLSSALLLAPLLDRLSDNARRMAREIGPVRTWLTALTPIVISGGIALYLLIDRGRALNIGPFIAEWRVWAVVVGVVSWVPMSCIWRRARHESAMSAAYAGGANLVCGLLMLALSFGPVLAVFRKATLPDPLISVPWWSWVALAVAYALAPLRAGSRRQEGTGTPLRVVARPASLGASGAATLTPQTAEPWAVQTDDHDAAGRTWRPVAAVLAGGTFVLLLILGGAGPLVDVRRSSRCQFDLPALRGAMAYVKANSLRDAIIFTDDWDVFPVYFYHNHHNRYIVGLDPKFSHERDPVLWERYVKITQSARFPVSATVSVTDEDGGSREEKFSVRLEDIRDHFGASFVITDPDHTRLAMHLEQAPDFAERVYPPGGRERNKWPPFTVFRVKPGPTNDGAESPTSRPAGLETP